MANAAAINAVRAWMVSHASEARTLSVSGDISVDQNGESNSASFAMKSKRMDATGNRIDSLSIEVMGPFGIKVAKFLASPQQYAFYDILHGQTLTGATDSKSLENLTQLKGISLATMSDLIYGLANANYHPRSAIDLYSAGVSQCALVIHDSNAYSTSVLDLIGDTPNDSSAGTLRLVRFRMWNGMIDPVANPSAPAVLIRFSEHEVVNGFSIPKHIEAISGNNKLLLEYDHIDLNPSSLTVKIKMPSQ